MKQIRLVFLGGASEFSNSIETGLALRGFDVRRSATLNAALAFSAADVFLFWPFSKLNKVPQICSQLKRTQALVVVISDHCLEATRVEALEAGADDWISESIGVEEIAARCRSLLRLMGHLRPGVVSLGDVELDLHRREIRRDGTTAHLTAKQFMLLRRLMAGNGEAVTHDRLLHSVWGEEYSGQVEYLRVFVNQLRKKLESDPANPVYIITEPAVGYRFQTQHHPAPGHVAPTGFESAYTATFKPTGAKVMSAGAGQ